IVPADEAGRCRGEASFAPGTSVLRRHNQFGFARENVITFAHFSVSSAMMLANSAGETAIGVPPVSARRFFRCGPANAALALALSFSTTSPSRFLGAPVPDTALAS